MTEEQQLIAALQEELAQAKEVARILEEKCQDLSNQLLEATRSYNDGYGPGLGA